MVGHTITFNVRDDSPRSFEMTDVGPAGRVVHGVSHVSHQHDIFSIPCHLTQAKRSPEYTHVGMNTSQHDIFDPLLGKERSRPRHLGH